MTRRRFKPLGNTAGAPTLERGRRPPSRRVFRQLSGLEETEEIPLPQIGFIYRTLYATAIADYESVATASWSAGVTGTIGAVPNSSWNSIYHHFTVASLKTIGYDVILEPIRWACDGPILSGIGVYDWWDALTDNRCGWVVQSENTVAIGSGMMPHAPTMLVATSHADFGSGTMRVSQLPAPTPARFKTGNYDMLEAGFQSLDPTIHFPATALLSVAYIRHRVNGSAVGDLIATPGLHSTTNWDVPIAKGDTYSIDVWYRLKYTASPFASPQPGKWCAYIPTTRVSNGSRRTRPTTGIASAYTTLAYFTNVDMSPNYNKDTQTYNVTAVGHTGWTLKGGSNGPHKIQSTDGWTGSTTGSAILWTATDDTGWVRQIGIAYQHEMVSLLLWPGSQLRTVLGTHWETHNYSGGPPFSGALVYRPTPAGEYTDSTTSTDEGSVDHAPSGVFNQAGTTTFLLVDWSQAGPLVQAPYGDVATNEGVKSPAPFFLFPEVPTSFTVTRVDK